MFRIRITTTVLNDVLIRSYVTYVRNKIYIQVYMRIHFLKLHCRTRVCVTVARTPKRTFPDGRRPCGRHCTGVTLCYKNIKQAGQSAPLSANYAYCLLQLQGCKLTHEIDKRKCNEMPY
jgi:hypothetical protein